MSPSDLEKEIISILREEKKSLFDHKLQLIRTTNSLLLLLFPFLILSFEIAKNAEAIYLLLPFVICSIAFFLIACENSLSIIIEYISRIDKYICNHLDNDLPLFQKNIGDSLSDWKLKLVNNSKYFTPNAYYLLGITLLFIIIPMYVYSIIKGNNYLLQNKYYWWNVVFISLSLVFLIVLIYTGIIYGKKYKEIRMEALNELLKGF